MESFQKRFIEAKEFRDLSWAEISRKSRLSKAQVSQYKNGTHEPLQDALYKLATALNVNIAWLMGHDVPMQSDLKKLIQESDEADIIKCYRALNDAGKAEFIRFLDNLMSFKQFKR